MDLIEELCQKVKKKKELSGISDKITISIIEDYIKRNRLNF